MRQVEALEACRAHPALQLPRLRLILGQRDVRKMGLMAVADDVILMRGAGRHRLTRTDADELLKVPQHPLRILRMRAVAEEPEMMRADVECDVGKQKVVKIVQ